MPRKTTATRLRPGQGKTPPGNRTRAPASDRERIVELPHGLRGNQGLGECDLEDYDPKDNAGIAERLHDAGCSALHIRGAVVHDDFGSEQGYPAGKPEDDEREKGGDERDTLREPAKIGTPRRLPLHR